MNPNLDQHTGIITIALKGDLTSTTADQSRTEIKPVLDNPAPEWKVFRLDLARAKMVDSVGLNFIITILKTVQKHGAKMQIVYANRNVHRTFLFTRLDKHVELISSDANSNTGTP